MVMSLMCRPGHHLVGAQLSILCTPKASTRLGDWRDMFGDSDEAREVVGHAEDKVCETNGAANLDRTHAPLPPCRAAQA